MQAEISFGAWLRNQRKALDLSQQALADQVGCAEVTLRRIEAGTLKPSKELAGILLEKLGLPETERLQWVSFARGLSGFPSLPTSSKKAKSNLPAPLTSFIGREREQAELMGLIAKHRLISLTGPGGVGKTRLCIKVSEQILGNYADGVWLVECAPILDPSLVPRTAAIAIGLRDETQQRPLIDMLCDYLRDRQEVIILDNCEHLLDACAQLADTLLKRCPDLKIIATSREMLGVLGEAVYYVPSLRLPDIEQLVENFENYEAIRLFEERARLARSDFSLTTDNASPVATICHRLDGMPLAIELAAARVSTLAIDQIAARLAESSSFLSTGNRTALPRHQSLRAALDWSYGLLSRAEQTVFQRLAVFVGGWTLEAAESICSDADIPPSVVLSSLTQLINKSLVVAQEEYGALRYHMLETIRQYANEKLIEAGEREALHDRHLEYFLNFATTAEPHLMQPEQIEWLIVLDTDYENLRSALAWAMRKDTAKPALRLCAALGYYWEIRGYWTEGAKSLAAALAMPVDDQDDTEKIARVRALHQDANLADALDDLERLKNSSELALRLANECSDQRDIAIARLFTGLALFKLQEFDKAGLYLEESVIEFQVLKDPYWEAYANMWLGGTMSWSWPSNLNQGRLIDYSFLSVELARKAGDRFRLARALIEYSFSLIRDEQLQESKKHFIEAQKVLEEIGLNSEHGIQIGLAEIEWLNGNRQQAKAIIGMAQSRLQFLGDKITRSYCLQKLGLLSIEEGELAWAQIYLEDALLIAQDFGQEHAIAERLILLSALCYLQGEKEKSRQNLKRSNALVKNLSPTAKIELLAVLFALPYFEKSENGAILLGALNTSQNEFHWRLPPLTKRYPVRARVRVLNSLGKDAFESAFAEGQKISLNEAFSLALKTVEQL